MGWDNAKDLVHRVETVSVPWELRNGVQWLELKGRDRTEKQEKKPEWLAQHLVSTRHSVRGSSKTWVFVQALQTHFISCAMFLLCLVWKDEL